MGTERFPVAGIRVGTLLVLLLATGCGTGGSSGDGTQGTPCTSSTECAGGVCVDGTCVRVPTDGGSDADADTDAGDDGAAEVEAGGDADAGPAVCGDRILAAGEACDDGNAASGDGCSADCAMVEPHYLCPIVGEACVRVVTCGNERIEGDETCDDGNTRPGDGCDAACHLEPGWTCPVIGAACVAAACGDGIRAGFEQCDDGNPDSDDGCDAGCHIEPGWACPTPDAPCHTTTCGDGVVEGSEGCEDGNLDVGDGCDPFCRREPSCTDGVCEGVCGDGVVWPPEECDDGNLMNGDGCSSTCTVETGFGCTEVPEAPPSEVLLPVTIRDFIGACGTGARLTDGDPGATPPYGHPDFECFNTGLVTGMVAADLSPEGKPVWAPNTATQDAASFALWYVDDPDDNRTYAQYLTLPAIGGGAYQFASAAFFPLDGSGFVGEGYEAAYDGHNFHFTSETRYWFEYQGTEVLDFTGDDDVWVFINRHLAVDIGGVHGAADGSVILGDPTVAASLGLSVGGIYEAAVFQAERHTSASNYRLTLTNFVHAPSVCTSTCGDGVVSSVEACDDGVDDGGYGGCTSDCRLGPYCGDGIVQPEFGEVCDDGLDLGGSPTACAPGCQHLGAVCGDGVVQTSAGEQCDDGNTVSGDGCSSDCQIEIY